MWETEGDDTKIDKVIAKFEEYCQPHHNVPFEDIQELGESLSNHTVKTSCRL